MERVLPLEADGPGCRLHNAQIEALRFEEERLSLWAELNQMERPPELDRAREALRLVGERLEDATREAKELLATADGMAVLRG